MKLTFLGLILIILTLSACCKNDSTYATVERDCTGTYLRISSKDYQVCNLEKVKAFADGAYVKVVYEKTSVCNGSASDAIVCAMLHANEGWVEVISIR